METDSLLRPAPFEVADFDHIHHRLARLRTQLPAAFFLEDGEDFLLRHGFSVWSFLREGVVYVGDGEDARRAFEVMRVRLEGSAHPLFTYALSAI